MDKTSSKLESDLSNKLEEFRLKQVELEDAMTEQKLVNEQAVKNLMSEVLWRIKDAEELIKSRVSEVRVTALIQELKVML